MSNKPARRNGPSSIVVVLVLLIVVAFLGGQQFLTQFASNLVDTVDNSSSEPAPTQTQSSLPENPLEDLLNDLFGGAGDSDTSADDSEKNSTAGTAYERKAFGPAWPDITGSGCDTRNDILSRDLTGTKVKADGCTVLTGTLDDPYTGKTITFQRSNYPNKGDGNSAAVQIDHIIPLACAWRNGADGWSSDERIQFANDPANLQATDGPTNGSKSDQCAWLPPANGYTCEYAERVLDVQAKYDLTFPKAEQKTIERAASC